MFEQVKLRLYLPSLETVPQDLTILHSSADHSQLFNTLCNPDHIEQHLQNPPLPEQPHLLESLHVAYTFDP